MHRDLARKIYNRKSSLSPPGGQHSRRARARALSLYARARARTHTHTHTHKGGRGGGGFLLGETRIADDGGDGIEGHVGHELSEHLVFILVRTDSFYFCL
jgi:hypothetical protein